MPGACWTPKWCEKSEDWRVDFRLNPTHRIRRRLGVCDRTKKRIAKKIAEELWNTEKEEFAKIKELKDKPLFSQSALLYAKNGGETRFLEKILKTVGPSVYTHELTNPVLERLALECYPNCLPQTRYRQFITPARAIRNLAEGKGIIRRGWSARREPLSPEEGKALLDAAIDDAVVGNWDPERHTLKKIAFMLGTGAGPGETFAVDSEDVFRHLGLIRLPAKEKGAAKTQYRARWAAPPDICWELMGEFPTDGRAFRMPVGKPYRLYANRGGQMARDFTRVRKAAGLGPEVTPYVLRHTFATWFLAQTNNEKALREMGGWSDKDMFFYYAKLAPPDFGQRLLDMGWDFGQNLDKLPFRSC